MNNGIDIKSLYINPQYVAKSPISKNKYLNARIGANPGDYFFKKSLAKHKNIPSVNITAPWPRSPNIIPNKKGKVTQANTAGFTSL